MAKKKTATQRNIDSINRYIQTVANLFGTNSAEYEAATISLKGFATRDKFVNGQAVIQLQNTKANRKKHQAIRAIKNKRKPVSVLKRKYEKKRREYQERAKKAGQTFDDGAFYRWYAEISHEFDSLWDEIYNYLNPACDLVGTDLDMHQAFIDTGYRMGKWETVFEKGAKNYTNLDDFFSNFESVNNDGVDVSTGENMTFTNDDYTDTEMEFD